MNFRRILSIALMVSVCCLMQAQPRSKRTLNRNARSEMRQTNRHKAYGDNYVYVTLDDFSVAIVNNEHINICSNYSTPYKGDIVIPEQLEVEGVVYPVKGIESGAFNNCKGVTSISLPASLRYIGGNAFGGTSVKSLVIPEGVEEIDYRGLSVGATLKSVHLPASLNNIGLYPFQGDTNLEELTISEENATYKVLDNVILTKNGKTIVAYPEGKKDETYDVPEGVEYFIVGNYGMVLFKELNLPASLTQFDNSGIINTPNNEAINVAAENKSYYSKNGVLFDKNDMLVQYPSAKKGEVYAVPEGTKSVGDYAFAKTQYLKKIEIPASVTEFKGSLGYGINVDTLVMHSTVPPTAKDSSMMSVGGMVLEVPDGCVEAYRNAAGWNQFEYIVDSKSKQIEMFAAGVLKYEVLTDADGNRELRVLGFAKEPDKAKNLTIPSSVSYDGVRLAVTEIAPFAFYDSEKILSISVAVSVKKIGKGAFGFSSATGFTTGAASELEVIGESAFADCYDLASITLPAKLKEIGTKAFNNSGSYSSMSVKIPASVERIGVSAFDHCHAVSSFYMEKANDRFVAVNGVLYSADMTELVAYPFAKQENTLWIPETVKTIKCGFNNETERVAMKSMMPPAWLVQKDYTYITYLYVPEGAAKAYEAAEPWSLSYKIIEYSEKSADIADTGYYLYNKEDDAFLARGAEWGVQAAMEITSVPIGMKRDVLDNTYTMTFLDAMKDQYLGYDYTSGDPYTDKSESVSVWECQRKEDGRYVLYYPMMGLWLKSNGLHKGCSMTDVESEATAFLFVSEQEELESIFASRHNIASEITATMHAVDKTDMLVNPTMATNIGGWDPDFRAQYTNGSISSRVGLTETYHMYGNISQTVTGLEPGIYRFSLEGFYRGGSNNACAFYSDNGIELESAYIFANDNAAPFATWASGRESDTNPNTMEEAYALIARGKYKSSVFTRVGDDGVLTIGLVEPQGVYDGWMIWRNATLTYYEEDPTGIITTNSNEASDIYSVTGVKLNQMGKGLYIVGGKKVMR